MKKVLVDTDVLFFLLEKKAPEYHAAATLLSRAGQLKLKIHFTLQTLFRVQQRLSAEKSGGEISGILRHIIQMGKVIGPDEKTYTRALNAGFRDLDFAIQYYTADDFHMDYFVSNATPEKKNRKMPVLTAEQFLEVI